MPFRKLWFQLATSLWFVPSVLVLGGIALAIALVAVEMRLDLPSRVAGTVFGVGADGARGVLTAIATSLVTVAGVAFSITIVTLSLAASQYSSRILRNFMGDRTNQVVLGVLIATFAYCVVVLQTIRGGDQGAFVPSIALFGGVLLSFVAIGAFVYFTHHTANAIQASSIVARVANDTLASVSALLPEICADEPVDGAALGEDEAPVTWRPVPALDSGYVQRLDVDGLTAFAARHGTVLRVERRIGAFAAAGRPLVSLDGATAPIDGEVPALNARLALGRMRTTEQDPAFGIRQLVDVALKALSPGVNDTTTAVLCVDWLGVVLSAFGRCALGPCVRRDEDGAPRVIAPAPTYDEVVALAVDEIRQSAHGNAAVLGRQLAVLEELVDESPPPGRRRCLLRHAERIVLTARRTILLPVDRAAIEEAARRIRRRSRQPAIALSGSRGTTTPTADRPRGSATDRTAPVSWS